MKVKTSVKAGGVLMSNHNQAVARAGGPKGIKVKSGLKAGIIGVLVA